MTVPSDAGDNRGDLWWTEDAGARIDFARIPGELLSLGCLKGFTGNGNMSDAPSARAIGGSPLPARSATSSRSKWLADLAVKHCELLTNSILSGDVAKHAPPQFPQGEIEGGGTHEAPRGTLSHWVTVKDGKVANYQALVPTTWSAGPRDSQGNVDRMKPRSCAIRWRIRNGRWSFIRPTHAWRAPATRSIRMAQ